jgi:hypothetical protein
MPFNVCGSDVVALENADPTSTESAPATDVVICNTVLHFARDDAHFDSMLRGGWRGLKPGELFFCRLGSSIGMESQIEHIEGRRYKSPDGSERYLVDEALLGSLTERLGAELADPVKTTVVQNQRAMTTWVLRKNCFKKTMGGAARSCFPRSAAFHLQIRTFRLVGKASR